MTAKTDLPEVPAALAEVQLIDAPTCAAAAGMSVSWWHDEVRTGRAPAPAIRQPRCTRWLLSQVHSWLLERTSSAEASNAVLTRAKKASAAAQAKRRTQTEQRGA